MRFEALRWMAPLTVLASSAIGCHFLAYAQTDARTVAATAPEMAAPTRSPSSPSGYFPLADVHRGLHGVAYTVFEGTQPEAMQVEILGVLRNALGPDRDMILARLQGSKPEYTGVVAGMSGSPVYIDGKLLGALSYRIGQFTKEPIAGITPIQQMLGVRDLGDNSASGELVAAVMPQTSGLPRDAMAARDTDIHPIDTPLSLSGFSPQALEPFRDRLKAAGLTAIDGVGGGSPTTKQPEPLVPGSAVSALLVTGDLEMAATCTVTYIDDKNLLACGHPITQSGAVSMPMTKAEVVATLASPFNAFKIVNTTELAGAFNQDRASAIRGTLGETATLIPVTIMINGGNASRTIHFGVIDDPQMTPLLVLLSTYEALLESNRYGAQMSYRIRGEIATNSGQKVNIDSLDAPTEQMPAAIAAAISVGDSFSRVYANRTRTLKIASVSLHIDANPGNNSLEIESAATTKPIARAGETVRIDAIVRPYHQAARHVEVPVALPASLPAGQVRVVLSGASELDRMLQSPTPPQQGLDEQAIITQLNSAHVNDALYATILAPGAQAALDGKTLGTLPISMVNVLEPLRNSHKMTLNGESAVLAATVPLEGMVSGQQVVTIEVE